MRDDARLARAGAGQDEQRPVGLEDGVALFGVEASEESIPSGTAEPRQLQCGTCGRTVPETRARTYSTVTLFARLRG